MKWPKIINIYCTTKSDRMQGGSQDFQKNVDKATKSARSHHTVRGILLCVWKGTWAIGSRLKVDRLLDRLLHAPPGASLRRREGGGDLTHEGCVGDYGAEAGGEEVTGRKEGQKAGERAIMRGAGLPLAELGGIRFHIRGKMLTADLLSAVPDLTNGGRWGILYNNEILRCRVKDRKGFFRLYR